MTLLHWKYHLRSVDLLGPNNGQVSTYTLFTILLGYLDELRSFANPTTFERFARQMVMAYLGMVPRVLRTPDRLSPTHNLTARTYLAADIVQHLGIIPTI